MANTGIRRRGSLILISHVEIDISSILPIIDETRCNDQHFLLFVALFIFSFIKVGIVSPNRNPKGFNDSI